MELDILRIASFADGTTGGNPAGVVLTDAMPEDELMQKIAADVGFSETVFAVPLEQGWRVRYFSPESEVPFCGHATIALGAALAKEYGAAQYKLQVNDGEISVNGGLNGDPLSAELTSMPTKHEPVTEDQVSEILALFGWTPEILDPSLTPVRMHGGADHFLLPLKTRELLADMNYDLQAGRDLMRKHGLVTIMLTWQSGETSFDVRNAFASGGVLEDPATGAAASAFAGYLRDGQLLGLDWSKVQTLSLRQGDDMGSPSRLAVTIPTTKGSPVRVSGKVRIMG